MILWIKCSWFGEPDRKCSGCKSWAQLRRARRARRRRATAIARRKAPRPYRRVRARAKLFDHILAVFVGMLSCEINAELARQGRV